MSINKSYAVFGLGKYGFAVAKQLVNSGADVLAVDINPSIVNTAANDLPMCKCADVTDADVIKQLGISNIDVVIISMATNLEGSVMAIALCKEAGVKTIIAKCACEMHKTIMLKVGADRVLIPESESGVRLAKNLLSSGFADIIDLSDNISVIELNVKKEWIGKNLSELNLRKKYSINVVAIKENDNISIQIDPLMPLSDSVKLIVIADNNKLAKLK